ncbi:MAG TPA: hypothetical protein VMT76_17640 [Puia sp.]|nr:hypothetical protein [Puia sp.]
MKKIIPVKKTVSQLLSSLLVVLFTAIGFSSVLALPINPQSKRVNLNDSIVIKKIFGNTNYSIELIPHNSPRKLLITINKDQKRYYHFYLFDTNGNLKAQVDISGNEDISFVNIEKGNYYYEILCNDERIENGALTVR